MPTHGTGTRAPVLLRSHNYVLYHTQAVMAMLFKEFKL